MKLSKCLLLIALSLSGCHAQTSKTYFGDGQTPPQRGRASSPPPLPKAKLIQPLPPGEPPPEAKPKAKSQAKASSKSKSKHRQHYRHHPKHHSPHQNQYAHP